jgi:hypothetical protein
MNVKAKLKYREDVACARARVSALCKTRMGVRLVGKRTEGPKEASNLISGRTLTHEVVGVVIVVGCGCAPVREEKEKSHQYS